MYLFTIASAKAPPSECASYGISLDITDIGKTQASSGRERPLCRQRHLSNMFQVTDPEP